MTLDKKNNLNPITNHSQIYSSKKKYQSQFLNLICLKVLISTNFIHVKVN